MAKRDPLLISALQWIERNAATEPMDQRVDVSFKRGATELGLLSQGYPGLQFTDLSYIEDLDRELDDDPIHIRVIGSGANLVRHGFLNTEQLGEVASCKTRKVLRDAHGACIEVERRTTRFRVRRRVPLDMIAAILAPHAWSPKARPGR